MIDLCKKNKKESFKYLYTDNTPILEKIEKIAKNIYKAKSVEVDEKIKEQIKNIEDAGFKNFQFVLQKHNIVFQLIQS